MLGQQDPSVKALAAKSGDELDSQDPHFEGENQLPQAAIDLHMHTRVHVSIPLCICVQHTPHTLNVFFKNIKVL